MGHGFGPLCHVYGAVQEFLNCEPKLEPDQSIKLKD